jgi:hypothetical protein
MGWVESVVGVQAEGLAYAHFKVVEVRNVRFLDEPVCSNHIVHFVCCFAHHLWFVHHLRECPLDCI